MQSVAGCGEAGDPSCPSSEDGYASASLDGAGSRGDAGSANGGVWDMSGVPVDYTFQVTPSSTPQAVSHAIQTAWRLCSCTSSSATV